MANKAREIKVISNKVCPIETINSFNKRIAEFILMKYSKEVIEKLVNKYEKSDTKND